jgi:hypothetical protein
MKADHSRLIPIPAIVLMALLACISFITGCGKGGGLVLTAERSALMGGEFLRFYKDGTAIYGFAVVKENIKAQGQYRYAHDSLYFLSEAFRPHFPEGCITIRGDSLYMVNGLHFKVTKNHLKP